MKPMDRFLAVALVAGVWAVVLLQVISISQSFAQEPAENQQQLDSADAHIDRHTVNATEVVGLKTMIERVVRERQVRTQSISGLNQHIKSVVRGCRVNASVTGGRVSNGSISC